MKESLTYVNVVRGPRLRHVDVGPVGVFRLPLSIVLAGWNYTAIPPEHF